ncbi:MAG: nuclear transport factor 2 family protein [Acidimicrobiales bacterium]
MTDTTAVDTATLVDTYLDMWRAADDTTRRDRIAAVFTPEGRHVDPLADVSGHDGLAALLANVHAQYPGFRIERTSGIDQYGNHARFTWRLDAADGAPIVSGLDIAELAAEGRIAEITSFWGDLPAR